VALPNMPTPLSEPAEGWMRAVIRALAHEPAYLLMFAVVVVVSGGAWASDLTPALSATVTIAAFATLVTVVS
jgi:hypothetical protein